MTLSYRSDLKQEILITSKELFFLKGYRSVSMDDIAKSLAISKKTLYKNYSAKDQLLKEVIDSFMSFMETNFRLILDKKESTFDEKLYKIVSSVATELQKINIFFLEDIKKSAPKQYQELDKFRKVRIPTFFEILLKEGQKEGIIKRNIHISLVTQILIASIQSIISQEVLFKLSISPQEAFNDIIETIINGVTNN
ncbi:MAG: TetR/AcrR family transcriptional regulator [Candidatus Hodarchaeales archaeon]|jgi:AcrR family transcriptional regulator